jgi:hypothetical protein
LNPRENHSRPKQRSREVEINSETYEARSNVVGVAPWFQGTKVPSEFTVPEYQQCVTQRMELQRVELRVVTGCLNDNPAAAISNYREPISPGISAHAGTHQP